MPSLIDTIEFDESLAKRLADMPPDSQTLTLSLDGGRGAMQHPSWSDTPLSSLNQTIDAPTPRDATPKVPVDEGFLPPRRIASLAAGGKVIDPATLCDVEYRLVGTLGAGGTGIVYQAHQRAIDREVAIKVLRRELASDPASRGRFLAEARVIGALDHPNVIALHDLCIDDENQLFYSMKRVDGASWDHQIDSLSLEKNLNILLRVADAIRYAHSRGLVHRDLKPENVMLGRFGEVLVADWGLAISTSSLTPPSVVASTESHAAIGGTPAYMAPELAAGDLVAITPSTDVYLLGAILYRIVTGFPPHTGDSLLACIRNAANNVIEPVCEGINETQFELISIAMKAMQTRPEDRFESVEQLVDAISDHRTHEASERMVRRAKRHLAESEDAGDGRTANEKVERYERFAAADALLREAIEIWPTNQGAIDTLRRLQLEFARTAASQGDLDLALTLYKAAGQSDSEAAARVRQQRDRREKVRESQAKYSTLFTHSPDAGLLVRWSDGVVMEANAACLDLLGYAKEELVGNVMSGLSIWACPERRKVFIDHLASEGQIDNFETQFVPRSTQIDSPVCDEKQQVPGLIDVLISSRTVELGGEEMLLSTIRDISLRRTAERELEQSRRRLRDLQRLAGLGTWSYTLKTETIQWSEETFRLTGRAIDRGTPDFDEFKELIHPEDREKLFTAINRAIELAASYQLTFRQRDDQGKYRTLFTRGKPVLDSNNNVIELYGILQGVLPTPS